MQPFAAEDSVPMMTADLPEEVGSSESSSDPFWGNPKP